MTDPDDPSNHKEAIWQTTARMSDLTDPSQWNTYYDDGDDTWAIFEIDAILHEDVENVVSGNTFLSAWQAMWDGLLWINGVNTIARDLPDADTTWMGIATYERWTLPSRRAASSTTTLGTLTTFWCLDEGTLTSGRFGTSDDGTYLEMSARSGGGDRIEVYLVGYYPGGEVRFVREMIDVEYLDVDGTACRLWRITAVPTPSGTSVSVSGGATGGDTCVWYPGDGSSEESHASTFSHTYTFPGTYRVMQVCYEDDSGDDLGEAQDEQRYTVDSVRTDDVTVG